MQESTRKTVFVSGAVLLLALLGLWWYSGFSLQFTRFFAAEPAVTTQTATPSSAPVPPTGAVGCTISPASVAVGGAVTATGTGGTGTYAWTAPDGTPNSGTGATFTTTYAVAGVKKITVQATRTQSGSEIDSFACTLGVQ